MLFKEVRDTYARYAASPSDDPMFRELKPAERESRYQRNLGLLQYVEEARPFIIDKDAYVLVNTLDMEIKAGIDLVPLMLEAPLPFNISWFEYDEQLEGEDSGRKGYRTGVMIRKFETGVFACCFFKVAGQSFMEPFIFISVTDDHKLAMTLDPHTSPKLIAMFDGSDNERLSEASLVAMSEAGLAISTAVRTMHLIATRQGPLDQVSEPFMSRQERRRLERQGALPVRQPPTITRIQINAQGRLHLAAVDDEEGGEGGARRRAHRVRGHYMRKAAGGRSWRNAHVRGFGPLNETTRKVGVALGVVEPKPQ